jgi:predicted TIM-barrel fold metal-dependent hydrolase
MKYQVISADNHVMEPPGTFVERVPAALRDRAPQVMQSPKGGEGWTFNGQLPKMTFSRNDARKGGDSFAMIPRGSHDGAAHIKDMQEDGVDAAVLYPGVSKNVYEMEDRELSIACLRAYNDWLLDDFCSADPSRLIGMCLLPTDHEPEQLLGEAERLLSKGARAFYVPFYPRRPLHDPYYGPLWQLISDAGAVLSMHNFVANVGVPAKPVPGVNFNHLNAGQACLSTMAAAVPLTYMIFAGVFERFPKLKVVQGEVNMGWVPYWVQMMRHTIDTPKTKGVDWWGELPTTTPEEYIGRNLFFTVLDDYLGFAMAKDNPLLARAGMYSTDYPHPITLWPRSRELIPQLTKGLPDRIKYDLLAGNAVRVFNLDQESP